MMVRTTISSTSVNPLVRPIFTTPVSPLPVGNAVQAARGALRIDVEHVVPVLGGIRRARIAAQSPRLAAYGIARDPAQEIDALAFWIPLVHGALHEHREGRRVAGLVERLLDRAFV